MQKLSLIYWAAGVCWRMNLTDKGQTLLPLTYLRETRYKFAAAMSSLFSVKKDPSKEKTTNRYKKDIWLALIAF